MPANSNFRIEEGDVLAAYLSSNANGLPIVASTSESTGRRLFMDTRNPLNHREILRRNDLSIVENVAMHLYADISKFFGVSCDVL